MSFFHDAAGREILYEARKDLGTYIGYQVIIAVSLALQHSRLETQMAREEARRSHRLTLKCGGRTLRIAAEEFLTAKAAGNYVEVRLEGGEHLARLTLADLQKTIERGRYRCRARAPLLAGQIATASARSHPTGEGDVAITLDTGETIPGSRRYRSDLETGSLRRHEKGRAPNGTRPSSSLVSLRTSLWSRSSSVVPRRAGDGETRMPAASMAAILSSAPPLPPETMAPAWPIVRPGGAVRPGDEADGRLLAALLGFVSQELRGIFLGGAADLTDHDDRLGGVVGEEFLEHIDEFRALDAWSPPMPTAVVLAEADLGGLEDGFIGQRAGARDHAPQSPS